MLEVLLFNMVTVTVTKIVLLIMVEMVATMAARRSSKPKKEAGTRRVKTTGMSVGIVG